MKTSNLTKIGIIALIFILAASCKKYEQGPKFTLLTAKMRVINDWASAGYSVSSAGGSTGDHMDLSIKRDGTYIAQGTHLGFGNSSVGTWEFDLDKTHILFDYNGVITKWKITRLKNNYLNLVNVEDFLGVETTTTINYEGK